MKCGAKVGIISLGCCRNLVDSESLLGGLKQKGFEVVDLDKAQVAIVNTCAFIKEATEESLEVIFDLLERKKKGLLKKVIVCGCLAQRYKDELALNLRGVDAFIGRLSLDNQNQFPRFKITPHHFAYVKICEGCINNCSYCVIPQIKGHLKSRFIDSIVEEIKLLDQEKISEVNLIGQDITSYGMDLTKSPGLTGLIKEILSKASYFRWLRLIYTHPERVNDSLIELIKNEERIVKYIDLPAQHINDRILKGMNRNTAKKDLLNLIAKLRRRIPSIAIRTSLIVGFPGEGEKEFEELLDFVKAVKFERLGVFIYSREEGTPAFNFAKQVPGKIKKERFDILMSKQQEVSTEINSRFMGKEMEILIDTEYVDSFLEKRENIYPAPRKPPSSNAGSGVYLGRTYMDAPEVDGMVYVHAKDKHLPGEFVRVRIKDTLEYDLVGEEL